MAKFDWGGFGAGLLGGAAQGYTNTWLAERDRQRMLEDKRVLMQYEYEHSPYSSYIKEQIAEAKWNRQQAEVERDRERRAGEYLAGVAGGGVSLDEMMSADPGILSDVIRMAPGINQVFQGQRAWEVGEEDIRLGRIGEFLDRREQLAALRLSENMPDEEFARQMAALGEAYGYPLGGGAQQIAPPGGGGEEEGPPRPTGLPSWWGMVSKVFMPPVVKKQIVEELESWPERTVSQGWPPERELSAGFSSPGSFMAGAIPMRMPGRLSRPDRTSAPLATSPDFSTTDQPPASNFPSGVGYDKSMSRVGPLGTMEAPAIGPSAAEAVAQAVFYASTQGFAGQADVDSSIVAELMRRGFVVNDGTIGAVREALRRMAEEGR